MTYLYGDSTPFPLDDNFIETLRDASETCVALLAIDEKLDELYDRQDVARAEADREQARLETLASALVRTLEPHVSGAESVNAGQVAVRVMNAARGVLEGARGDVSGRRDVVMREVETTMADARAAVPRALEQLLARRELPGTTWRVRWTAGVAGAASVAQAEARTPFKLAAVLELDIPASSAFAHPVRVGDLDRNVTVRLPQPGGWLRKRTRLVKHNLDGWYATEVELGPERSSMTLRRSNKHPSPGLEIVMAAEGQVGPTVKRLTETGRTLDDATPLAGLDALGVQRLWAKLSAHARGLLARRTSLVRCTLDNRPIKDIDRPATIVQRLVGALAPFVRDMRRKSAASSELVLKRDLGNGRREELWIARDELTSRWRALTPSRRAAFEPLGLVESGDEDPTRDYGFTVEPSSYDQTHERRAAG
jgi:hypothetical protein